MEMSEDVTTTAQSRYLFVGNLLCLDLVNTEVISGEERVDLLGSFEDLAAWLRDAGVVDRAEADELRGRWAGTGEAAGVLDAARRFRATLRDMAERIAAGERVPDEAVAAINALLARPVRRTEVRRDGDGFVLEMRWRFERAEDLLVPAAESARDLLCAMDLHMVRKCRNPRCILYFYDTTKNHKRAWCSMSACGNRTKVAAHYRRKRGAPGDS